MKRMICLPNGLTTELFFVKITVATAMNGDSIYRECHREGAAGESLRRNV